MAKIRVPNQENTVLSIRKQDYMSVNDKANAKDSDGRDADIVKLDQNPLNA